MARIRTIGLALGGRGVMGLGLGRSSVGAAAVPWWLSGGVAAANCVAAYQSKGAASLAASYVNLANPGTYDAAPGVAPDWDSGTGWTFNGSTQYLTTGVMPSVGWSMIARFSDFSTNDRYLAGAYNVASITLMALCPTYSTGVQYWNGRNPIGIRVATPNISTGVLCVAGGTAYRNGVSDGSLSNSYAPTVSIYLGALNKDATPSNLAIGSIQAVAIYSATLSAAQVALISAAMAAL